MWRQHAKKLSQRPVLIRIVVERLDREHLIKEIFFPWNLLCRSPDVKNIVEIFRRLTSPANHLIRHVQPYYLAETFRTFCHQPCQKPSSPARAASQIKHTLARAQIHQPNSFFRDVQVMAFHLFAFTLIGPAIKFQMQLLIGVRGLVCQNVLLRVP